MKYNDGFGCIYPFTTENVSGYLERLNLKGKDVLTVGSSLDQLFNAIVLGAKKITVLDISPNVENYFWLKREVLLRSKREDFYDSILHCDLNNYSFIFSKDILLREQIIKVNNYLKSDFNYEALKQNIDQVMIEFVVGDIFQMKAANLQGQYDRIILSNVLQYMEYFCYEIDCIDEWLKSSFLGWDSYLRGNGILQLLYLYSFDYQDIFQNKSGLISYDLKKIFQILQGYSLDIEWIDGVFGNSQDAIVTYTKKLLK